MRDFNLTVASQYPNSPTLAALITSINEWIDPDANFELFYTDIWNIDSAGTYGLDVWGRIVVIPRVVTLTGFGFFGFGEAGDRVPFGQGPFGDNYRAASVNFTLTNDVYRRFILAKAAYNITNGSVPAINAIMMNLFPGRGNCYVVDGGGTPPPVQFFGFGEAGDRTPFDQAPFGDNYVFSTTIMTLTYTFEFPLQAFEAAMVQSGVLPKPTGVLAQWNFIGGVII